MKFTSIATLLAVFVAATTAVPTDVLEGARDVETRNESYLDGVMKDMPRDEKGHFDVVGKRLISVDADGNTLAARELEEDMAVHVRRSVGSSPTSILSPRARTCLYYYCDENADCLQWYTSDGYQCQYCFQAPSGTKYCGR
ncbi:hypothetical protein GGS26DRAFT_595216 [Hypomontagnella submonticulosa]|nr:hypothetical protein GGS26DRAFT_595216 [Hypomontagnella submonticulosa]